MMTPISESEFRLKWLMAGIEPGYVDACILWARVQGIQTAASADAWLLYLDNLLSEGVKPSDLALTSN